MRWLFIRFYVCVLIVLFLAWFIHGAVWARRSEAEAARIYVEAHGGGARLVASDLSAAGPENQTHLLARLSDRFNYPVVVLPLQEVPNTCQRRFSSGHDVAYFREQNSHYIFAALAGGAEAVRLGPFPDYELKEIEDSIGGWMRFTADKVDASPNEQRQGFLERLQRQFDFPIEVASRVDLPDWPRQRLDAGEEVVFYPQSADQWCSATPLADKLNVVRFGPFPGFPRIEQKAATTTLALVLLPVALAIALLLRPVSRQLRRIEHAALAFAGGDLSARVHERRVGSAKSLALAFNHMAQRTETLVRTQRELLQAVSHELRTPLSRIRFAVDLIETAEDDEQRKRRLESLDAAADDLDELVGELLSYVRMETASSELNREHIALRETVDVLIPKHAALYPSIKFDVDEPVGNLDDLVVDRTGFQRALGNLLSNAGRFAHSRVTVSAELADGTMIIDVDDDGKGIPAAEREKVFEPFVRLSDSNPSRGVGLGLALVKRIVMQHGGRVEVLDSPLGGCRIRTTWPAQE